jgi:mannosyltransferase OCH1-like enzyme
MNDSILNNDILNNNTLNNNILNNYKKYIIPKYLAPRKDIFLKNKYKIYKNYNSLDDFHIAIYFIEKYKCKIIVRRLDAEEGWCLNLIIKIFDLNNKNIFESISIGSSEYNEKIIYIYTHLLLEPVKIELQNIPRKIIQTSRTNKYASLLHYNAVQTFIELNPEYEYHFYDDNECRDFIKNNFDESVLDSYDLLYPGAFKADLFRYCYIYINGGCYFDNKYILRMSLRKIVKNVYNNLLCKDTLDFLMFNAIILSVAKRDEIKNCIYNIVDNVKNNYYGQCPLSPTGPRLFNNHTYNQNVILKHRVLGKYYTESKILIIENEKLFANTHYKGYYYNKEKPKEEYADLFHKREIYYLNLKKISNYTVIVFPHHFSDSYNFDIINNSNIKITRNDSNEGWGQNLKIKLIDNNTNDTKIISVGNSKNNNITVGI